MVIKVMDILCRAELSANIPHLYSSSYGSCRGILEETTACSVVLQN